MLNRKLLLVFLFSVATSILFQSGTELRFYILDLLSHAGTRRAKGTTSDDLKESVPLLGFLPDVHIPNLRISFFCLPLFDNRFCSPVI